MIFGDLLFSGFFEGSFPVFKGAGYVDNQSFLALRQDEVRSGGEVGVGERLVFRENRPIQEQGGVFDAVDDLVVPLCHCGHVTETVVDDVWESFVVSSTSPTSPVSGLASSGGVEGEEVEPGAVDEAPVCESGELPILQEVRGDRVGGDEVEGLPLVRLPQEVGVTLLAEVVSENGRYFLAVF